MFEIKDLHIVVRETGEEIIHGASLVLNEKEVQFLLGPNGSGKSSLALALAGSRGYVITKGKAVLAGKDILVMKSEERAQAGLFLSFQSPVSIAGLSISNFLKYAVNSNLRARGKEPLKAPEFFSKLKEFVKFLDIPADWVKRDLNAGFSGGEKKKIELLQMLFLEPRVAVLDEIDSGLDVDAIKLIGKVIEYMKKEYGTAFLIITHYDKLFSMLSADKVYVFSAGEVVKEGGRELADEIHNKGFEGFIK